MGSARHIDTDLDRLDLVSPNDAPDGMTLIATSADKGTGQSVFISPQQYLRLLGEAHPAHTGRAVGDVVQHWRRAISSGGLGDLHVIAGTDLGVLVEAALATREQDREKEDAVAVAEDYLARFTERASESYRHMKEQQASTHRRLQAQLDALKANAPKPATETMQAVTGGAAPEQTGPTGDEFLRLTLLKRVKEVFRNISIDQAKQAVDWILTAPGEDA